MRGMIFGAGLGTRLRPLTDVLPKPVIPVLHRPLCARAIDGLRAAGAESVVINTHHLAARVVEQLSGEGDVLFAHEPELLGTGGGVKNAVRVQGEALGDRLGDDEILVAWNGDVMFEPDLEGAIALHRSSGAIATMIVREDPEAKRFGAIEVDDAGRVRRLLGLPEVGAPEVERALRVTMFTGVHVLSRRAIDDLPERGCIVRQGYRRWVDRGEVVAGFVDAAPWRDLGTPREYRLACLEAAAREPARAVHPDAVIDRAASIEQCVVGPGAIVDGGVRLERCVVWPGTHVRESARERVLAGEHSVEAS